MKTPVISATELLPRLNQKIERPEGQESESRLRYAYCPLNIVDLSNHIHSVSDVENERSSAVATREKIRVVSTARMQAMLRIAASYEWV
jgi:hypothetical protein